jgi:DNA processing protein
MDPLWLDAWIASVPGIGPRRYAQLASSVQDMSLLVTENEPWLRALKIPEHLIHSLILHRKRHPPDELIERCHKQAIFVIKPSPLLSHIDDPPIVLYGKGTVPLFSLPCIAVVGTRKITEYGTYCTRFITTQLVQSGFVIVSGFMYGVDRVAHETALFEHGLTIGVLGFGFEYMYPREHMQLASKLIESGSCLLTEYPPWQPPAPGNFPQRNRIVSGMSLGVVVTEAAKKSGSLITARLASEQGREVFAVPGPIDSPLSEGTKALINLGAKLVTNSSDIIEELRYVAQ